MADNFEDDKGKKKDSADFAQIMNVVNDIKGRVKDLNPVTFESLKSVLANVLDAHPEVAEFANIKEMFEQLELTLKEEEQRVKSAIVALINEENRAAEVKRIEEEAAAAAEKLREEIERRAEVAGVYKAFDSFHKDYLKEQQEESKHLDNAIKAIEEGREIDAETKKKLTKTPAQIEEEKRRWQHIKQTDKTAEEETKLHSAEIQNIKKLEEKVAHLPANHPERVSLANTRKYHEHHHGLAEVKKAECAEHYKEMEKDVEKTRRGAELAKKAGRKNDEAFFQNIAADINKICGVTPEKHDITPKKLVKEISTEISTEISLSPSPGSRSSAPLTSPAMLLQQNSDTEQVAPNSNEKERINKVTEQVEQIKEKLGYGQKQPIAVGKTAIGEKNGTITPNETPNAKAPDPKKGRAGRW